jgi:hypothetical protein
MSAPPSGLAAAGFHGEHICEVCFGRVSEHDLAPYGESYMAGTQPCCPGCPCGTGDRAKKEAESRESSP